MKKKIRCLLGALLSFCAGGILWADSSHLYDLSEISPVWDISGTYTEDMGWGSVDLTFVQDGSGKISGGGSWEFSEGSDVGSGDREGKSNSD